MASTYDKVIVTNWSALRTKYGTTGEGKIRTALAELATADRERGLTTKLVRLDSAASVRASGATKVAGPDDWVGAVRAVDRIWQRYQPSYVVLLGSPDVVPQARVTNPFNSFGNDGDPYVPSDLPYACDLPDGRTVAAGETVNPSELVGATRVVGRVPDLLGATEPSYLLGLLSKLCTWKSRPASAYHKTLAISAAAWERSTRQSLDILAGQSNDLHLSPPAAAPWTKTALAPLTHFVNCHGADTTPDWFGQGKPVAGRPASIDTVAMRPEDIDKRIKAGTIVAAECCYGSMHMDPAILGGRLPILLAYLRSGAYACIGASTTSYGPADGLGQADLLCRFSLEGMIAGASAGRALLEARQRFGRETGTMGPSDLKTLVQFELLGDPSVVPVQISGAPKTASLTTGAAIDATTRAPALRIDRRRALRATGLALAQSVARAAEIPRRRAGITAAQLARTAGIAVARVSGPVRTFGEDPAGPQTGVRYHAAPVTVGAQTGFVVARQWGRELIATTVWRK